MWHRAVSRAAQGKLALHGLLPSSTCGESELPNAGGKTASLKALGLAALMPRAGLFVPVNPSQADPASASESPATDAARQPSSGTSTASGDAQHRAPSNPPISESLVSSRPSPPRLLFFDRVLADVGDSQSLEQNLSTFSGHVRRMGRILKALTPSSLVLLDEVGCCKGAEVALIRWDTKDRPRAKAALCLVHVRRMGQQLWCRCSLLF